MQTADYVWGRRRTDDGNPRWVSTPAATLYSPASKHELGVCPLASQKWADRSGSTAQRVKAG
jgi:hypothetical protein